MRLSSLLLGVTALLLASINAAASIDETNTVPHITGDQMSASNAVQNGNRGTRFLRTDQGNKWDVEEDDEGDEDAKVTAEKMKSGVILSDIDRLNTRLTRHAELQKIKLMKRLKAFLTKKLAA
ncbi:hypothetical protein PF004_g14251 [Phytophthora fragariae]|uniref:RxLR effector protein n=1 Tax=Phytophthora fragariae TaxID=53985 RepID=A0A6A3K0D2_9STRA|nr:hypothetical protein PF011_g14109 [Phytophthora fragariae]KAE9217096.1 hypothetical protein PF004_g14251 [Phytophthora fragariae]KAE9333989.1 hypothetical protein PF008_g14179 [Phytophthora fragariae]